MELLEVQLWELLVTDHVKEGCLGQGGVSEVGGRGAVAEMVAMGTCRVLALGEQSRESLEGPSCFLPSWTML